MNEEPDKGHDQHHPLAQGIVFQADLDPKSFESLRSSMPRDGSRGKGMILHRQSDPVLHDLGGFAGDEQHRSIVFASPSSSGMGQEKGEHQGDESGSGSEKGAGVG